MIENINIFFYSDDQGKGFAWGLLAYLKASDKQQAIDAVLGEHFSHFSKAHAFWQGPVIWVQYRIISTLRPGTKCPIFWPQPNISKVIFLNDSNFIEVVLKGSIDK